MRRNYPKYPNAPSRKDNNLSPWKKIIEKIQAKLGGITANHVIALTTTLLAFFSAYQVWTARDTERRQLRASVYIESEGESIKDSSLLKMNFSLKNGGATTAHHVTEWDSVVIGMNGATPGFKCGVWDYGTRSVISLSPGETFKIAKEIPFGSIPRAIQFAQEGKLTFFIWGIVNYYDDFGDEHYSKFRYRTAPDASMWGFGVLADSAGNESD